MGTAESREHKSNRIREMYIYSSRVFVMGFTALSMVAPKNWLITQASSHQLVLAFPFRFQGNVFHETGFLPSLY